MVEQLLSVGVRFVVDVEAGGDREPETHTGRRAAGRELGESSGLVGRVGLAPSGPVLCVVLRRVDVRVHAVRGEKVDHAETRRVRPRRAVEAFDDARATKRALVPRSASATRWHTVRVGSDRVSGRSQGDPDHDCDSYECARHPRGARAGPARHGRGRRRRERWGPRTTVTFDELNRMVNRLANGLYEGGARAGERLVWCGPNSLEVLATIHAARKLGTVAVPLSYRFNAEEMAYVIDNSDATTVVVDAEQAPLVAEVRGDIPKVRTVVVFGGAGSRRVHRMGRPPRRRSSESEPAGPPDASEAGAAMIYTSGTTGKPKGALRTTTDRELVFALLGELNLLHAELGAPHDRAALPLGPARVRVAVAHARRAHRRAPQVRRGRAGSSSSRSTASPTRSRRRRSSSASSRCPTRRSRGADMSSMVDADRQRRAGAVRAEAGDHRQAR